MGGTAYETLFSMYGPDGASGPYMLVMLKRRSGMNHAGAVHSVLKLQRS